MRDELGTRLQSLVLAGSAATGSLAPSSDLDLIAVADSLEPGAAKRVATRLSHRNLPCPARALEFVLYDRAGIAASPPRFALNLNTGRGRPDHVGLEPDSEPWHWFPIDLSIARCSGRALVGPAPAKTLPDPSREAVMTALLASLEWHEKAGSADTGANAWRAWRFTLTGAWPTKQEARRKTRVAQAMTEIARATIENDLRRLHGD